MDLPFLHTKLVARFFQWTAFQSLFLWIFRSYDFKRFTKALEDYVSILVLMDLPFLLKMTGTLNRKKVSILVLMDLPFLQMLAMDYESLKLGVSILVLMDLPFLHIS